MDIVLELLDLLQIQTMCTKLKWLPVESNPYMYRTLIDGIQVTVNEDNIQVKITPESHMSWNASAYTYKDELYSLYKAICESITPTGTVVRLIDRLQKL